MLAATMAVCTALGAVYGSQRNDNLAGAQGDIAFIFLHSACYAVFSNIMV